MFSRRTDWKLTHNRFTEAQLEIEKNGRKLLDLTVSNPTRVGVEHDRQILQSLLNPEAMDYDPQPKGLLSAREAVANYYQEQYKGIHFDPESLILTTSTSEGYSYVFRLLCNPEDEVLVPKPSYPLFEFLADLQDVKLVPYPLIYDHGWQIDFPSLQKAVNSRTRAIVVVHPNNPTGSYASQDEQSSLNRFCNEHGLALIVDEVFLDYALDEVARPSFAANQEVLTFTLSGLSKISALPQMKVAWIATSGPEELVSAALARLEVIADTYLSMNAPLQLAIPVLLEQKSTIQPQLLERVRANLSELDSGLAAHPACRRLQVEGGWYAVLRVPVTQADNELAIALLREQAVLVHPGHFYDFEREGHFVLSLITRPKQFREGVRRFLSSLQRTS
jgi:aspartate/methionine/tyrosine aminotransferase